MESASESQADIDRPQFKSLDLNMLAIKNEVCSPFVPARSCLFAAEDWGVG